MAFEIGITIKQALENIQAKKYAMPAIQREFVWSTEQIERLFDSLMQGYPIGSFLSWNVEPETVPQYKWYDFVIDYHQRNNPYCPPYSPLSNDQGLIAILDGQQRLTALNIGLRGTYAEKLPRLRWNNSDAFPEKMLYLNIESELREDERGMKYEFKFLTRDDFSRDGGEGKWYKVRDMLDNVNARSVGTIATDPKVMNKLRDPSNIGAVQDRLFDLWQAIHQERPISFYVEQDQDLDKVLNIFIRTNSGGTVLSSSDLLLSIAASQWTSIDARQELHDRIEELNDIGDGFSFDGDFILKAGLVLADVDVRFRLVNFTAANLKKIEDDWSSITSALRTTVELASQFGLSGGRLTSQNALLPIAYYVRKRGFDSSFVTATGFASERSKIRHWLFRTLIGRVWGGASDTLLTGLRDTLRRVQDGDFPVEELTDALTGTGLGRNMTFSDQVLDDIVDTQYARGAFTLLALMYPFVDVANSKFHVDHVFPRAKFSRPALERAGLTYDEGTEVRERMNRLGNLQLMPGPENISKQDKLPYEWLQEEYPDVDKRDFEVRQHDLGDVPEDVRGFVDWYEARRAVMLGRLRDILGTP